MRDYSVPRAGVLRVSRVGTTTSRSSATARRSDDLWTRNPPAPAQEAKMSANVGLRRDGPISVVGAPRRSYGYAVVAPPRIWGRRARNAARCSPLSAS